MIISDIQINFRKEFAHEKVIPDGQVWLNIAPSEKPERGEF